MKSENDALTWNVVERLDWHLWILTITLLFVLGVSLLAFMFPTVSWFGTRAVMDTPQRAFLSFCIFLGLVLVYLMQRQSTVRQLKRQLYNAECALRKAQLDASIDVFLTLPERPQLRDALAMEFRRAMTSGSKLSQIVFQVQGTRETLAVLVSALRSLLRSGENMYRVGDCGIVVILPNASLSTAAAFAGQVEQFVGLGPDAICTRVTNYPEEVSSLRELEARMNAYNDRVAIV